MTEEEMSATVRDLKDGMSSLSNDFTNFLKLESDKHQAAKDAATSKANTEVEEWEKGQTFLKKHGTKIATFLITVLTSGLAWYGAEIKSEIHAEQRAEKVDKAIETNRADFDEFTRTSDAADRTLQMDSVNQTIMIEEGFKRFDKVVLEAHPRQFKDESDLPPIEPAFTEAATAARKKKLHYDKFGVLPDAADPLK